MWSEQWPHRRRGGGERTRETVLPAGEEEDGEALSLRKKTNQFQMG